MSKPLLDIIITHCDEPFEDGVNMFSTLARQRMVEFSGVHVIIVQDGVAGKLHWPELLDGFPYQYEIVTIAHAGPAAARNAGLLKSQAEYVMFCDYDDMFTTLYSLYLVLNVLPTDEEDALYSETMREELRSGPFVNMLGEDFATTDGKIYRRTALLDNNILFNPELRYLYARSFNEILYAEIPAFRIKKLTSPFPIYVKALRRNSHSFGVDKLEGYFGEMLVEKIFLAEDAAKREKPFNFRKFAEEALFDGYFILNTKGVSVPAAARDRYFRFAKQNMDLLRSERKTFIEMSINASASKIMMETQRMFNYYSLELMPPVESISDAMHWIDAECNAYFTPVKAEEPVRAMPAAPLERVVVYNGTRNTYESMVLSAKSLLDHTRVDKIYFLTEDDVFPAELPEIITNINVKNQAFFREDGPNFKSAWTYMCLMRAAYTKILPQHDRILSLDIDVSINEDISELWDIDLSGYYIAGVPEIDRPASDYINFGVVMMNLRKLREDGMDDTIISSLNTKHWDCPEQSAFSYFCHGKIYCLPCDYNYTVSMGLTGEPEHEKIIHYAGVRYWKHYEHFRRYIDMPWENVLRKEHGSARVAVYAATRNMYPMMELAAKSLLSHTRMDKIIFLIEDDTFPSDLPNIVRCINISGQKYFRTDGPNYRQQWTYMTLMRAALPDMLPMYDTVLWLDCDTLVNEDISPLFDTDLSDAYFAAVQETRNAPYRWDKVYYNAGVMLMNLRKLRGDGMAQKIIDELNAHYYNWPEQTVMNFLCYGHIADLPSRYNVFHCTDVPDRVAIRHYVGGQMDKNRLYNDGDRYDKPWDEILKGGNAE